MTRQRRFHRKSRRPNDPQTKAWKDWPPANQGCFNRFQDWLRQTSSGASTLSIYSAAARWALGWLDKPYWTIDPDQDLSRAGEHIQSLCHSPATWESYRKGLVKFAEFLRYAYHQPEREKHIRWEHYLESMPDWLSQLVRDYLAHCQRGWLPAERYRLSLGTLSCLTRFLRFAAGQATLDCPADLNVRLWHAYLDLRLEAGIHPATLNTEFQRLRSFLLFLKDLDHPVNERLLRLPKMKKGRRLPKDVPVEQLRLLLKEIERDAASSNAGVRRTGLLDRAAFLLMLHCALRSGEVRRLKLDEIDWAGRRLRIEQSKGLKDRMVYLSEAVIAALQAYLAIRGPADALPEQVFIYRHKPLSPWYFYERLRTYAPRCGVLISPHQLRHSAATLLLNAGAPATSVQAILGHRWVGTTLGYVRLYDETVSSDYHRAMVLVQRRLEAPEDGASPPYDLEKLMILAQALHAEGQDAAQAEVISQLKEGLLALFERHQDVKVQEGDDEDENLI